MRRIAGIAAAIVSAAALSARAQQPVPAGGDFQVSPTQAAAGPAVGGDGAGSFVITWSESHSASDVWAQRYDPTGLPVGDPFRVNSYTTGFQAGASVSMNAAGDFAVVWASYGQDGNGGGVFGQRFDASGAAVGSEFQVSVATLGSQTASDVALGIDGRFVVVWGGSTQGGAYTGSFGRRFDAAGNPEGAAFPLGESSQEIAGVGADARVGPTGEFVTSWVCCPSPSRAVVRRFGADGAPLGPVSPVDSSSTSSQGSSALAMDAGGRFVVTWTQDSRIRARLFEAGGEPAGDTFGVATYFTRVGGLSSVAMAPDGAFVVVWRAAHYVTAQHRSFQDIFARTFDAAGQPTSPEFRVNAYTTGYQVSPSVAVDASGGFLVSWEENGSLGSRRGVFARRFVMPPDLIFADGFESGDLSAWSASQTDAGDLGADPGAAMASTAFGAQAIVDDQSGLYVQDDSPTGETRYRARFYVDPAAFDPGEASGNVRTRVFLAFADAPLKRLVQVVLRRMGGTYSLAARVRLDDDTLSDTPFAAITAAPHVVEIDWHRSSRPTANDGTFELSIDGASVATLSGLDNDLRPVDFVRLGALSVKAGASGTLRFDEFASRRWSYIGP